VYLRRAFSGTASIGGSRIRNETNYFELVASTGIIGLALIHDG
jgi:hypothetical protein